MTDKPSKSCKNKEDSLTLKKKSKNELIQLAKDLSSGCYEKESEQREKILQMIVDELAEYPVR